MNQRKIIINNIIGLSVYIIVDFILSKSYDFINSIIRGLVFLILFNIFEQIIRRRK